MLARRQLAAALAEELLDAARSLSSKAGRHRPRPAARPPPPPPAAAAADVPQAVQDTQQQSQLVSQGDEWTEVQHQTGVRQWCRRGELLLHALPRAAPPSPTASLVVSSLVPPPSQLVYYWNQRTGETTAIGEPKPGPAGRLATYRIATRQPARPANAAAGLGQLVLMGAGVGLAFALLARVF